MEYSPSETVHASRTADANVNYTFPTYSKPLFEYRAELVEVQKLLKAWRWFYIVAPILWIAGGIFAIFAPPLLSKIAIPLSLCLTIIFMILLVCFLCDRSTINRRQRDLLTKIKITMQYVEFMRQGYDSKDAYRFTLEWWDRQKSLELSGKIVGLAATCTLLSLIDLFLDD